MFAVLAGQVQIVLKLIICSYEVIVVIYDDQVDFEVVKIDGVIQNALETEILFNAGSDFLIIGDQKSDKVPARMNNFEVIDDQIKQIESLKLVFLLICAKKLQ